MSVIDGNLEVVDRRGKSFLWLFDLITDYRYSDFFEKEGRPYSARFVNDDSFNNDINQAILSLENIIAELGNREITKYRFLCNHENVEANTFEDIIETVIKREPINW